MVPQKSQAGVVEVVLQKNHVKGHQLPSSSSAREGPWKATASKLQSTKPTRPNSSNARQKHGDQPPASGIEGLSNNSRLAVNNRSIEELNQQQPLIDLLWVEGLLIRFSAAVTHNKQDDKR